MLYEVTCNKCGVHYRVTTQGGETRKVTCPSCGQKMTVAFPVAAKKESRVKHTSETHKALWAMLVVLIIGLPLAGWGVYSYQQHEAEKQATLQAERAARKAHVDSLNNIRAQQEAARRQEIREQALNDEVAEFLTRFYDDTFFGSESADSYRESLTQHCYERLLADGNAAADSLAWGHLYPTLPDADREELHNSLRVQPQGESWYRVMFTSRSRTQTRLIRVVRKNTFLLIDDYR